MTHDEHSALPDFGELTATEALAEVVRELRGELRGVRREISGLASEVDRLRLRIRQPHLEELNKRQAAEALGVSTRTIEVYARRWREGDRLGLEHHYRRGRGGRVFYTMRVLN